MKKYRICMSAFSEMYPNRTLGSKERYLQTFYVVTEGKKCEVHQKLNVLGKVVAFVLLVLGFIPVTIVDGLSEATYYGGRLLDVMRGSPVRKDGISDMDAYRLTGGSIGYY